MAAKKKKKAIESVEEILFKRPTYRSSVAKANLDDTLKHTKAVLEKAERRARRGK